MPRIDDQLSIPEDELEFRTSRSSGPGGQNVNKVESRVTLLFDLDGTESLSDGQKVRIKSRLRTRVSKAGVLRVVSQKHRTQKANREAATERFVDLIREALTEQRARKPTRVSRAAKRRRLDDKRRRSDLKRNRRRKDWD